MELAGIHRELLVADTAREEEHLGVHHSSQEEVGLRSRRLHTVVPEEGPGEDLHSAGPVEDLEAGRNAGPVADRSPVVPVAGHNPEAAGRTAVGELQTHQPFILRACLQKVDSRG